MNAQPITVDPVTKECTSPYIAFNDLYASTLECTTLTALTSVASGGATLTIATGAADLVITGSGFTVNSTAVTIANTLQVGAIELGHASQNSLTASSGVLSIEDKVVLDQTNTLSGITNKTFVAPVLGAATGTSLALGGATIGSNALAITGTANFSGTLTVGANTLLTSSSLTVTSHVDVGSTAVRIFGSAAQTLRLSNLAGSVLVFLYLEASDTLQLGVNAAGVSNQILKGPDRITSDGVGGNLTIAGGRNRGASAGGSLIFQTSPAAGAGVTGTLTTRLTIDSTGLLTLGDACNIAVNTGTGTKIGTATTQKLGFYNATPVDQPDTVADPSGGGTQDAEARTAIVALIDRLQELGLIA